MMYIFRAVVSLFGVREGELINERLDIVLVNLKWLEMFPNMQVFNMFVVGSNLSPIIMNFDYKDEKFVKRFKFEAKWLSMEESEKIVLEEWGRRYNGPIINQVM